MSSNSKMVQDRALLTMADK